MTKNAKAKTTRKQYDWEAIERVYRAGQLSIREIAKKYGPTEGTVRQRAKRYSWSRDLTQDVQKRTKDKLLRTDVRTPNAQEDSAIVEEAAERGAEIVRSHRRDINDARGICGLMMAELRDSTVHNEAIADVIEKQADDEEWDGKARAAARRAISLQSRAGVMRDMANSMKVLQGLERTAFNLDDQPNEKDPLDELLDSVMDSSRGVGGYDADGS
ncbi:MAG: hypothetical protein ACPH5V_02750 [Alcanivorax sp.]